MKVGTDVRFPNTMNPTNFGDPVFFPPVPPTGRFPDFWENISRATGWI